METPNKKEAAESVNKPLSSFITEASKDLKIIKECSIVEEEIQKYMTEIEENVTKDVYERIEKAVQKASKHIYTAEEEQAFGLPQHLMFYLDLYAEHMFQSLDRILKLNDKTEK
jgi:L-lactate utilization protein LutC